MIYTVTLNPAIDNILFLEHFNINSVNRVLSETKKPGGKGINVARILKYLGIDCLALGIVGKDNWELFARQCKDEQLKCRFWASSGSTRTNTKIVDLSCQSTVELNESGVNIEEATTQPMLEFLYESVKPGDIIALSGSLPPGLPTDFYQKIIRELNIRQTRVFLDTNGLALKAGLEEKPYFVKPNLPEYESLRGRTFRGVKEIAADGMQLVKHGIERPVISLGTEGALFFFENAVYYAPSVDMDVKCTVGAGDAMVAAMICALQKNLSEFQTIRLAMATATAAVSGRFDAALANSEIADLEEKITFERINV